MARITLHIESDSASDMKEQLAQLFAASFGAIPMQFSINGLQPNQGNEGDEPDAGARQDAEPGERQTRIRRTADEKARGLTVEQAMAERAAQAAVQDKAMSGSATTAQTDSPETAASTQQTSSQPSESSSADPFAEQTAPLKLPSQATSGDSQATTLDAVKSAMSAWLARDGNEAEKMKPIFAQFKTVEGDVAQRASQLQPGDYAAFIEALAA